MALVAECYLRTLSTAFRAVGFRLSRPARSEWEMVGALRPSSLVVRATRKQPWEPAGPFLEVHTIDWTD